jgi:hypothetical protein
VSSKEVSAEHDDDVWGASDDDDILVFYSGFCDNESRKGDSSDGMVGMTKVLSLFEIGESVSGGIDGCKQIVSFK